VMMAEGYTSNASASTQTADYMLAIEDLELKIKAMGINLNDANTTLSKAQEREIINALGKRYLEKQKKLLPKLMVALKGARECIENAEDAKDASTCINSVNRINEELGDRTAHYDYKNWNKSKKEAIIKDIDEEVSHLRVTIDCVKKNDTTTGVIECTEGSLNAKE